MRPRSFGNQLRLVLASGLHSSVPFSDPFRMSSFLEYFKYHGRERVAWRGPTLTAGRVEAAYISLILLDYTSVAFRRPSPCIE